MTKGTARGSGSVDRGAGRESARGDGKASPQPANPSTPSAATTRNGSAAPSVAPGGNGTYAAAAPPRGVDEPSLLGMAGLPIAPALPTTGEYFQIRASRRRRLLRLALLFAIVALIAETAWLSPFTDGPANAVPRVVSAIPLAEVQPYGVNTFLHKEVESFKKDTTLQSAQELGVGWIKQQFPWAEIEYRVDPQRPFWDVKNNQNAWAKFDDIVQRAQQYDLRIIARIDSTPAWARPEGSDPKAPPSPERMEDFGNFIGEFVSRYRGSVAAIQVWNEPNLRAEWLTGRAVNAGEYTELLKVAYEAAKQANPDIIVLAAPLATNNKSLAYDGNLNELDYLQQMYDAGAGQYFDAMAANAYGTTYAPEDEPSRDKLNFRRVELLRAIMEENGDAEKSVWFNEYGWNASPAEITNLPWGRVTPEQQGEYTVRGIRYAREYWPWAGVFTIWYLRQVGDIGEDRSDYYFMLVSPDFVNTTAYRAIQAEATTQQRIASPGSWGPLSPPVSTDARWRIGLDEAVPGGMYLYPSAVGIALEMNFTGTDLKVQMVPATGITSTVQARYYVAIDGSSRLVSSDLPRDRSGRAYIDLMTVDRPTEVVLAKGINSELRTGTHNLTITAAAMPEAGQAGMGGRAYAPTIQQLNLPGIAALTVEANRSYVLFGLLTAGLLALASYMIWALRKPSPSPETSTGR